MEDRVTPSAELQRVIIIAEHASKIVRSYFNKQISITTKSNDEFNFLTKADLESNKFIQAELKHAFPDDQFLLEETDERPSNYEGRVWMVDPLDGTKEFINGGQNFAVMIGLCVDGQPTLGCIVKPTTQELYWAEQDMGAYKRTNNGDYVLLRVNDTSDLSQSRAVVSVPHGELRPAEKVLANLPIMATIPGASLGLRAVDIAERKAEFFVNTNMRACKWDSCAPQIILEEAGGKITDIFGKPLNYLQPDHHWNNSFFGSNGLLHDEIVLQIKGIETLLS